jgi:hypothetical protein
LFNNYYPESTKKSYTLFLAWVFLNAILLITSNVLIAFVLLGQGVESSVNLIGLIFGGFVGLFIGLGQWFILKRNFSISSLWILSCVLGFAAYYAIGWIACVIIMGLIQQWLIHQKTSDTFLWFAVSFISLGLSGLLLLREGTVCYYGVAYGVLTGALLVWYKDTLSKRQNHDES